MTLEEAKERLKQAADEYNLLCNQYDLANEDDKTALAWKGFRLHRNYREAFVKVIKVAMIAKAYAGSIPAAGA